MPNAIKEICLVISLLLELPEDRVQQVFSLVDRHINSSHYGAISEKMLNTSNLFPSKSNNPSHMETAARTKITSSLHLKGHEGQIKVGLHQLILTTQRML